MYIGELTAVERFGHPMVPPRYAVLPAAECKVIGFWADQSRIVLKGVVVVVVNMLKPSCWWIRHVEFTEEGDHLELLVNALFMLQKMMESMGVQKLYCWLDDTKKWEKNDLRELVEFADFKKKYTAAKVVWTVETLSERSFLDGEDRNNIPLHYPLFLAIPGKKRVRIAKKMGLGNQPDPFVYQWSMESPWSRFCFTNKSAVGAISVEVSNDSDILLHAPFIRVGRFKEEITARLLREVLFDVTYGRGLDATVPVRLINAQEMKLFTNICGKPDRMMTSVLYEKVNY